MILKIIVAVLYVGLILFLGYKGMKNTKGSKDFLVAGGEMNPFVMAMSYGATFVSTSAIIGFAGVASLWGFSLLWLTFLNIAVGIFGAMAFFGKRTRRQGVVLNANTMPELLGRRYQSRFVQGFSSLLIFLFVPVYAAAVLIGISRMLEISLGIPYSAAMLGFTAVLAIYLITGGLKGAMYTDAFQGSIMIVMMLILLGVTYASLGGVVNAHETLSGMSGLIPESVAKAGITGWTEPPSLGSPLWLTIYTTIIFGVGIGVLAQPQLALRYMTVKSDRELNRAVIYGAVFIFLVTGVAYVVGGLSNAVFFQKFGKIAIQMAGGNVDKIIPVYIESIMPSWYSALFLLGICAAAMSTLSGQCHVGGASLSHDFFSQTLGKGKGRSGLMLNRAGVGLTIFLTLIWAWILPGSVVALATAFFFGLCAAAFLPVYTFALYWKRVTKKAAIASMGVGFFISMFWLLLVHKKEAAGIGLCRMLFGSETLVSGFEPGSWIWSLQYLDANIVALPVAFLVAWLVSLATPQMPKEHVERCFSNFPR